MVARTNTVLSPNLGLYLDRPPLSVPLRGLLDGKNFRIKEGTIESLNLGWGAFGLFAALNGPVTLIDNFFLRSGSQFLVFGTTKDLYKYVEGTEKVVFLTPRYGTGNADPTNGSKVVVGGTNWNTNLKAGDEMFFGTAEQTDPEATGNGGWYVIDTVDSAVQVTLKVNYTGTGGVQVYTGRKLFAGAITDIWDSVMFFKAQPGNADLWFATNGVDDIVKWDTSANQVTSITSLNLTCKRLLVFKNMLIYGHLVLDTGEVRPTSIANSDVTKPEDISGGLASEFIVHDGEDAILHLGTLGDNLVIYGDRTCVVAQFVGDPEVMVFRIAFSGIGPQASRLVADFGDFHKFIGPDGQYRFDGVTVDEVGSHVWREAIRQRDPSRIDLAFSHFDEENGDLLWVIPLTTDPGGAGTGADTAWVEHYLERVGPRDPVPFSYRETPFTASGFFERKTTLTWDQISDKWEDLNFRWNDQFFLAAFPFNLVGDESGKVFTLGTAQKGDGTALASFVRFGRRALSDGRMRGLVARVYPFAQQFPAAAAYDLDVTLHLSDHASGPTTVSAAFGFDLRLPEGKHFVSPFRRGRFAEVEFGEPAGNPWGVEGYDMDVRPGGRR